MREVAASAEIAAPPEELFDFLAEPANLPSWQTGVVAARQVSPGELGVGSTAQVTRDLAGQRMTVELRVTGYERPSRLLLESAYSGIGVQATLELTPSEAGTRVRFGMAIRAQNMFMAPIEGLVAGAAEKDLADSLARLRAHFSG